MRTVDGSLNSSGKFIWKSHTARLCLIRRAKFQEKLVPKVTFRLESVLQLVFIFRKPRQTSIISSCTSHEL